MKKKIVLMGYMFRCPISGVIWQHLHYIVGFQRLGFEVDYLEDAGRWAYDADNLTIKDDWNANLQIAQRLADQFSFRWGFRASYHNPPLVFGCSPNEFSEKIKTADAVLNVCGVQAPTPEFDQTQRLVYVESDPGWEQIRLANGVQESIDHLGMYRFHFTFGESIGRQGCLLPVNGMIQWRHTRQPVILDFWKSEVLDNKFSFRFTTISGWIATGKEIEWQNELYQWSKHLEFLKFAQVPRLVHGEIPITWEIAVGIGDPSHRKAMTDGGWALHSARELSQNPLAYQNYIQQSDAEWTIAKDQYTRLHTGWFSDRSACYLAAARPVITQETGFTDVLPHGEGLFAFQNIADIQAAVDAILSDPRKHSMAAEAIAHEYFDAEKVCRRMAQEINI
jgi:hypothetical protein